MLSRPRRVVERPRANPVLRAVVWMGNKASIDNHVGNDATVHQRAIGAAENERHQLRKRVIDAKRGILSRAGRCVANIDSRADGELNAAVSARFDAEQRSRESATNEQRMRAELAETNRSGETARAASGALQRIPRGDHAQAASIPRDELAGAKNMTTCLRGDLAAWEDQWRRRRPTPTPRMGRWAFRTKSLSRPASRSAGSAPGFRVIRRRSRSMSGAGGPGRTFRRSVKGDDDPAESWPHDLLWDQVLWVDWEGRLEVGSGSPTRWTAMVGDVTQLKVVWSGRGGRSIQGAIRKKFRRYAARTINSKYFSVEDRFHRYHRLRQQIMENGWRSEAVN